MKRLPQIFRRENVKVLIAMGDPDELEALEYMIAGKLFNYRKVDSIYEALKTAREFKPNLIIIEVVLPEFDGLEMASKLRSYKKYNNTRFIFLTEKIYLPNKKDPAYSEDDFNVMKPLNIEKLSRKLDMLYSF